jgi:hypothetical protein
MEILGWQYNRYYVIFFIVYNDFLAGMEKIFKYNNTFEDFTYKALTYDINNFDITYMFLSTVISKVIYKKNQ